MSVLRQFNWLGQARIDASHLRSLDSSIAADFDTLVGRGLAGDRAVVVRGFALSNVAAGTTVTEAQLIAADSLVYNLNASESGSFLWVPTDRAPELLSPANSKVTGSFTANAVNYVGIDFKRSADTTTTDLVQFLDPNTLTESPRSVPLGRTLDYVIVISTAPFSTATNITPVAKITTDIDNKVVSVQDARPLMFRLGSGGDFPDSQYAYSYPFGRQESTSTTAFTGGDKNISSEKDWKNAVMTRLWELGGGENWYSPTADRNVRMVRTSASVFSNGENFEVSGSDVHWRGLTILFDDANNTGVYYNEIADQLVNDVSVELKTQLAVGECLYVDIDRTQNLTGADALVAHKATLRDLGSPTVPGSRYVIAWRDQDAGTLRIYSRDYPYVAGQIFSAATTTSLGAVKLSRAPVSAGSPYAITTTGGTILPDVAAGANQRGLIVTGLGNEYGVYATGGATGAGIRGTGGAASGHGVEGVGGTSGNGGWFLGADSVDVAGVVSAGGCTTDVSNGVEGYCGAGGGIGVYGLGDTGVYGASNIGRGVYGLGITVGVEGEHATTGPGVYGHSPSGYGIQGLSTNSHGVHGVSTNNHGVYGLGSLYGVAGNGSLAAVFGQGTAASTASGGTFIGGSAGGPGVLVSGTTNNAGVYATSATGQAIEAVGGTNNNGVYGLGNGSGTGIVGVGGSAGVGGSFTGTGVGHGVVGTGGATGRGGSFTGGATSGVGVYAVGTVDDGVVGIGGTAGHGVKGVSVDVYYGVYGTSSGSGAAVKGEASGTGRGGYFESASSAAGVEGLNSSSGPAVKGSSSGGTGVGGSFTGGTGATGVVGQGGGSSGAGVVGTGGASNGIGVQGTGTGTGAGVFGVSTASVGGFFRSTTGAGAVVGESIGAAPGVVGYSTSSGYGAVFVGNATRAPLQLTAQGAAPGTGVVGDLYVNSGDQKLYICTIAGTPGTWSVVGSQ